ncbi:MAG TPA: thiamine diphosphokinase [Gammaproteobacteria bacterium]|jgi:thiamine pyrophosphokinase|nr:thiamine diphosphokinase [Gammaproteobacteria bacterium]
MTEKQPFDFIDNILDQLGTYRSVLCLNGELPSADFFARYDLPIVAADGATNQLAAMGIDPVAVIGDLDSVAPALLDKYHSVCYPSQATGDFQKSLCYLSEKKLLPTIVLGTNGGYLDHVLNNISIMMHAHNVLYAPPLLGFLLKEAESKTITLAVGTKISLFGIPTANVSSTGLKWELDKQTLSFPESNSCFNRTVNETISLESHNGILLVLLYLQPIQDAGLTA